MPLDPLVLDDLDWRQLTDAARLRIPALSAGQWTLHAPVDPGITLVELYAWLLDQRVYWMDRVSEPLFRAAIGVLGESMQPVRAARTATSLERGGPLTEVPAGTTLEIARATAGPVFSTVDGLQLLKVGRVALMTPGPTGTLVDHSNDLREQRGVTLFAADGASGEAKIVLYLPAAPPSGATRPFSLFLDVDEPPAVLPEWNPEAVDVDPPAEVTWWYSRSTPLPPQPFDAAAVHDGTGGLRRSGIVRLPIPADWAPDGAPVGGLSPYSLFVRTRAATFTFPPRVRRIVPNTVMAEHRRVVRETRRITDWLPLPGLAITLDADSAPPIPDTVRVHVREVDGQWHRWQVVNDFARSGPAERVFHVDRARRRIEFGDGLTGRIPRPDPAVGPNDVNVKIALMAGAGAVGNVAAGLSWTGDVAADVRAVAQVAAVGGDDAETVDQARVRIAGLLDRVERAVTADDHVTVAKATPGIAIARAHAAVGFHPGHPCNLVPGAVTVFVVPWAPRGADVDPDNTAAAPMPDPGALAAVRSRLERARMVGTEVWVCPPRYRIVRLFVRVLGEPVDPAATRLRIDQALRRFLDPLEGGDDGAGWPFGDPIRPSVLMREATRVLRDGEVDLVAIGLDGAAPSESCDEVAIGPHDLPSLHDVAVTFAADSRARAGGLR
jgi:predicted phage baseplate assembly protein